MEDWAAQANPAEHAQITTRLVAARDRIAAAALASGRGALDIRLLLATKTQSAERVRAALEAARDLEMPVLLGENRVQELTAKAPLLADLAPEWHVIGHLQSNKVNPALEWASCVESVDSHDLARRLSRTAARMDRDVDALVQVNVSGEPTKSGVRPLEAFALALVVASLPRLRLRGFMTIGANSTHNKLVAEGFARLREIREDALASRIPGLAHATELSMGMSGDLELAIAHGATIVRLGTAVFGPRDVKVA